MLTITKGIEIYLDVNTRTLDVTAAADLSLTKIPLLLWLTFDGAPAEDSGLIINVTLIKAAVCEALSKSDRCFENAVEIINWTRSVMADKIHRLLLARLNLQIRKNLNLAWTAEEPQMIQMTTKYEIAASHRLVNNRWDDQKNFEVFGKCTNPAGHGHNYILEITVAGEPNPSTGQVANPEEIDRIVNQYIVEPFDHKNLNQDAPQFDDRVPTVENMALIFWDILNDQIAPAKLYKVKIWETPRTYAEYTGE